MKLFVCILKDYRIVEDMLLALLEHGVTGGTTLEGRGMGQIIGSELPIFAGLRGFFPGSGTDSHILLAVVSSEKVDVCFQLVEQLAGPLDTPGAGIAFSVPIDRVAGLAPEIR